MSEPDLYSDHFSMIFVIICMYFSYFFYFVDKKQHSISRRPLIAVIGEAGVKPADPAYDQALALGKLLVDAGYRVCNGGLSGVMEAVFRGARDSASYREGDTVAIIPGLDCQRANPYADIVIATGLGHLRNGIVAAAEAIVVVGGKAGTLSEIALAWRYNRLIVALSASGGMAEKYAGKPIDNRNHRSHPALRTVADAKTPTDAVEYINQNLAECFLPHNDLAE